MMLSKSSMLPKSQPQQDDVSESLITETVEAADAFISQWITPHLDHLSSSSCSLFTLFSAKNRGEGRRFIEVLEKLQHAIQSVIVVNPDSAQLARAKDLMNTAMTYLEKELYRVMIANRRYLDPESVSHWSSDSNKTSRTSGSASYSESSRSGREANAIVDLKMIANCMISSGYQKECVQIYTKLRKNIITATLNHLGFEKLTSSQMQKLEWKILEKKIKKWVRITKLSITTLFNGERILSHHIFSSSVAESTFTEITLQSALKLFVFPITIAKFKKTPEKIFRTLDLHQTLSHLIPKIEQIFSYDSTASVRSQAIESLEKLSESVNSMMTEFQSSITNESSKTPIPGGGIHQLARYVMNFIVFLADYTGSLATILKESSLPLPEDYLSSSGGGGNSEENHGSYHSPMTGRLAWLILVLLCKIDAKSRLYNDVALSYLFLASNLHYVLIKVRTSNLRVILGDDWVTNHEIKVRRYLDMYEKKAWRDVFTSLPGNGDSTAEEEESLRRFNQAFEEAYRKHRTWVVPDPKLRGYIRESIAKKLVSGYSGFYEKYPVGSCESVRFTPEDLDNCISDLYIGLRGSVPVSTIKSLPDPGITQK